MSSIRIPPQNLEAEKAVIGSVLIDNSVLNKIYDIVKSDYFYDPKHTIIFETMIELYNENSPVDVLTLSAELKKKKKFKQSGGASYIADIITQVPTSANVQHYAELVKEAAIRRKLIEFSAQLDEMSRNETKTLEEVMNETEKSLLLFSNDTTGRDFYDAATLLELQMQQADEFAKNPNAIRGIPTGLVNMDKMLGGLQNSDLVILAARPGVGKSAFSFHLARNAAVNHNKSVAIFSLEMPAVQVMSRILAQQIQVNLWNLRMGKMDDNDYKKYSEGAGKLAEAKIFIDDTPGLSIPQLRSKARKLSIEKGLDLIVVDYLQLMQGSGVANRAQEVAEQTRALKILARELNIPIVTLSQLNRAMESGGVTRKPQLSDLRESGAIEQDADIVVFLSRKLPNDEEQKTHESFDTPIKVDVIIAKHRNGAVGDFELQFLGSQQRYIDVV